MNPWRRLGELPSSVWATCITTLINRMGTMAVPFLTLFLTDRRHYSESQAGLAVACYGLAGFLTAPYVGRLTDRVGPLRLMLCALTLSGVMMLVVPAMPTYPLVVVAIVLWATVNESPRPASFALLTDAVPPEQKRNAITLYRTAINLGMSVGPAVGGLLAAVSYYWIFSIDAITCWLAAIFLAWSLRSAPPHVTHADHGRSLVMRDRRLWRYLASMLPVMVVFFQHTSSLALYMVHDLGLPPSVYGVLFTVNTGIILACEVPLSAHTARWPYRVSLPLGAGLIAAGFGLLSICSGFWSVAGAVAVWTCGEMLLLPASGAYLTDLAPAGRSGEYVGMQSAMISVSMMLAPSLGTAVLQHLGSTTLWIGACVAGSASAVMLTRLEDAATSSAR